MRSLLPFHSSSRDNRRQLLLAKSLQRVEIRRLTERSGHRPHCRLHSFRDYRRPRCPIRHPRARPPGPSPLLLLRSPRLLISLHDRLGLGNGHACQARSTHLPTPLISHNSHGQPDRALKVLVMPTHFLPFLLRLQRRGSARRTIHNLNCRYAHRSFLPGQSLHSANHIDIVSRAGLISRHEHNIA